MPLLTYEGEVEGRDRLAASLLRERDSVATSVELIHDDAPVAKLRPEEAIALGQLLIRMGEEAASA